MRDLLEMTYKCRLTPATDCPKCEYYNECLLSEIICVYTGNAPPIIDYPTPTEILYAEGEWTMKRIRAPTIRKWPWQINHYNV